MAAQRLMAGVAVIEAALTVAVVMTWVPVEGTSVRLIVMVFWATGRSHDMPAQEHVAN